MKATIITDTSTNGKHPCRGKLNFIKSLWMEPWRVRPPLSQTHSDRAWNVELNEENLIKPSFAVSLKKSFIRQISESFFLYRAREKGEKSKFM